MALSSAPACDAEGLGDGEEGGQPDVAEPAWDDAVDGADPVDPVEPVDPVQPDEELADDPAAPYLPVPTGPLGGDRPAKLTLPDDYDPAKPWPLVMLLHGYSASGFIQDYYLGIGDLVDERDFIYILPDGTTDSTGKQFWNAAPGCCNWYGSGVDDFGYLVGLVEEAMEKYHVDPTRVVLIGHSNGGYMSHQLACDRADLFTAIASIAGTSYADLDAHCAATHPVSVLQIHGTLDVTVRYDTPFAGLGAEETVAWWSDRDGCEPGVDLGYRDYDAAIVGDETRCTGWSGGESGSAVEIWKMLNSGHIPLFTDRFTPDVLDFLLNHPRQ